MLQPVASWLCTLHCLSGAKNVLLICPLFFLGVFSKGRTYLSLQFKALSERRRRTQTRSDKETIGSLLTEFHAWWVTRQPETCAVQGGPVIKKKINNNNNKDLLFIRAYFSRRDAGCTMGKSAAHHKANVCRQTSIHPAQTQEERRVHTAEPGFKPMTFWLWIT